MTKNTNIEKPPLKHEDAIVNVEKLSEASRTNIMEILDSFDDAFWKMKRKDQTVELVKRAEETDMTQKDIAKVMDVSEKTVSKTKYQFEKDGNVHPRAGRPSTMAEILPRVDEFI